ncbi:hypothetical protein L1987_13566 [Smallanthus sonchifolius]|uniref:Uncharacterized protein n=1 Tax=Smallanthus sonchifolius TaxID=185202 RepID=A0ACB9JIE6_9ASTR|nr:hypothetical protein L1987_13566 [Smallanthus sonchifolius]
MSCAEDVVKECEEEAGIPRSISSSISNRLAKLGSKVAASVELQRVHTISSIDGETLKPFDEYTMSQIILLAVTNGGANGMLVVVTGASHVAYESKGTEIPARIARKMQKKNQTVILIDPERQYIRQEGEAPIADFL